MTLQDDPEAFVELLEGCCGTTGLAQVTMGHSPFPTIATIPDGGATALVRKAAEVPRFLKNGDLTKDWLKSRRATVIVVLNPASQGSGTLWTRWGTAE